MAAAAFSLSAPPEPPAVTLVMSSDEAVAVWKALCAAKVSSDPAFDVYTTLKACLIRAGKLH